MKKLNQIDIQRVEFIDPEAADILKSAIKTVKTILDKRAELDRKGHQGQTLYVMAGESHDNSAHILHHLLVIKGLQEAEDKMTVGIELPYNSVSDYMIDEYLDGIAKVDPSSRAFHKNMYKNDARFRGAVEMLYKASSSTDTADYANKTLSTNMFKMIAESNGDFIAMFNDTARRYKIDAIGKPSLHNIFLDAADPDTANIMKKAVKKVDDNMRAISTEGMYVRSFFMAQRLYNTATKHKSRIALQLCGQHHVNGDMYRDSLGDYHYDQGLCAIFKRSAQPVIGVFTGDFGYNARGLAADEFIQCKNVPEVSAKYGPFTPPKKSSFWSGLTSFFSGQKDLNSLAEEKLYIHEKLSSMGLANLIVKIP